VQVEQAELERVRHLKVHPLSAYEHSSRTAKAFCAGRAALARRGSRLPLALLQFDGEAIAPPKWCAAARHEWPVSTNATARI
jgi:hypothetical protein